MLPQTVKMQGNNFRHLFVYFLVIVSNVYFVKSQKTCNKVSGSNCACDMSDGSGRIDLMPLASSDATKPRFLDLKASSNTDKFSWNPCNPFNEGTCQNVAVCQKRPVVGATGFDYFATGRQESAIFSYKGSDLILAYKGDDTRATNITLICDQSREGDLSVKGETADSFYEMTLTSKYACPKTGGLSTGSILLIIFFTLLIVYLVVGILYNAFLKGSRGVEVVPNLDFWKELPSLVKDGTGFVIIKVKGGSSGGSYENI